ncbi:MAG TPA: phosphoribosylaminoimidazolesuccinocarboxamide synthase [Syntrophorhabdaceae bacterium]|mgnify:FL=1|nr:phosphoribosylaminoimidazolesuccinocarboxamide synthase [Syntrophorhabdaceae bacterium]HNZ58635.1 phosphoribosylaminoimidazolesuccinocarboxamide synthase [Syntrophorhabdaceae bacterium]HOG39102.1 phosphoribosylaminoimidazolesuccinocarboxamide synthase [Syntrophorhabdaceae bacterium]
MVRTLRETQLTGIGLPRRGKVRDIYDLGDKLLIVATDRISAFDVVLPAGIPDKGKVLTRLSLYWFEQMNDIIKNHLLEHDVGRYPEPLRQHSEFLEGRSMLVKKAKVVPVECVVRGYLSGSGWKDYKETGKICGIFLKPGLVESEKLETPIFTPTTKAEEGHDMNISLDELEFSVGYELASRLKNLSIAIYEKACAIAEKKGIIIADTKFEFGIFDEDIILIDEVLTPDSSRFWSMEGYKPGMPQDSYDKQIVRDYLNTLDWDKTYPGPQLPEAVIDKTRARYIEILEILTERGL